MSENQKRAAARRTMILIAGLFLLPVVIAYGLYYSGWRPASFGNHGELVEPARPIADVALMQANGKPLHFTELRGKWTLILFSPGDCLGPCADNLVKMRQVIAALGEKAERVQSVLFLSSTTSQSWLSDVQQRFPEMHTVIGPKDAVHALAQQFVLPVGNPLESLNRIYLVDPIGNWMMSYPAGADGTGLRKDLSRLLRVSRVG